jgi:putative glutamine amidotransferase
MAAAARVAVTRSRTADASDYLARLREAGLEPVEVFEPGATLSGCAGLLITGGRDLDPALYGEEPQPQTQEPNRERDELDFSLLEQALSSDLPVLAICRGHQVLNVLCGGSLQQHIPAGNHAAESEPPNGSRWHEVTLEGQSKIASIYGRTTLQVNSRHHQSVTPDRLASGLVCAGLSLDGCVEALESRQHRWVIGVQWHPEREEPGVPSFLSESRLLFITFSKAVREG